MSAPAGRLSAEQVAVQLAKAREHLDHVPIELRPAAEAALRALETHAGDLAVAGNALTLRVLSWWDAFRADPPAAVVGRAAGLAAMQGATDRLLELREQELAAAKAVRGALLAVGQDALRVAIPLLVAAAL